MSSKPYSVLRDGKYLRDMKDLPEAIGLAEELLGSLPEGELATFSVETEDGFLLASATNRRITGKFIKQKWDDRDEAQLVSEEIFDATDYILRNWLLNPDDVYALRDNDETTDHVGQVHISWTGPHEVEIVDSVCEFFGIRDVTEITDNAVDYVNNRLRPEPAKDEVVTLSVKVRIRVAPGTSITSFVENLDYTVTSNTPGITVQNIEIVDAN